MATAGGRVPREPEHERELHLVLSFQRGDQRAFDELVRMHRERLVHFCTRRLNGDAHGAEEVAQESFIRAHAALPELDGARRFGAWLRVIAARQCIDYQRKNGRVVATDPSALAATKSSCPDFAEDHAERDHAHHLVRAALPRLNLRHQETLRLNVVDNLSRAELAQHLAIPPTTVEPLVGRARAALRREVFRLGGAVVVVIIAIARRTRRLAEFGVGQVVASVPFAAAVFVLGATVTPWPPPSADELIRPGASDGQGVSMHDPEPRAVVRASSAEDRDRYLGEPESAPVTGPTSSTPRDRFATPVGNIDRYEGREIVDDQPLQVWVAGSGVGLDPSSRLPEATPEVVRQPVERDVVIGEPPPASGG